MVRVPVQPGDPSIRWDFSGAEAYRIGYMIGELLSLKVPGVPSRKVLFDHYATSWARGEGCSVYIPDKAFAYLNILESHNLLFVSQIYSREAGYGMKLYKEIVEFARRHFYNGCMASVREDRSKAMLRLFKAYTHPDGYAARRL